jgi:fatty acyl-ACP thioesterase A
LSLARFQVVTRVAFHKVGPTGCLGLVPLADHLQEAAAEHARDLGASINRLAEMGLGWVMTRLLIRMEHWPPCGETIHIETWPSKRVGHLFYREFRLHDGSNLFVGAASSSWALFDVHARQVAITPRWIEEAVRWDPEQAVGFEHAAVPRLTIVGYEQSVMPRLSDLDINGHVNNAQLLGWTLEALPREVSGKQALREIDIFATSAGWMTRSHRAPKRRTPASSTTASSGSMMAANSCARSLWRP